MSARLLALAAPLVLAALAATACRSSGAYGGPGYAAANVAVGAVGAAASRATGGCLAECIAGTHCNRATGLCESERPPLPVSASPTTSTDPGHRPPLVTLKTSYPPGHEFEVPALGDADAGCAPPASSHEDGGVACEMDGGTI